jgi:hypothetical protein
VPGITFDDVIAFQCYPDLKLAFHELVHLVQYGRLGLTRFARSYTAGFLTPHSYEDIPLERCAFELEARFARDQLPFEVGAEIDRWIKAGLF